MNINILMRCVKIMVENWFHKPDLLDHDYPLDAIDILIDILIKVDNGSALTPVSPINIH